MQLKAEQTSSQRSSAASEPQALQNQALLIFLGTCVILVTLLSGIAIIFAQTSREAGGLPPPEGPTLVLYGGVSLGVAVALSMVVWAWLQWKVHR